MAWIRLNKSELRRVAGYHFQYNAKGYILMEFGQDREDHIRLDLERYENRQFYRLDGMDDYSYRVNDFHVKIWQGEDRYLYSFYAYRGGGVWQNRYDFYKKGDRDEGPLRDGEFADCRQAARAFLAALRDVTKDIDQSLAVDAAPEQLHGLNIRGPGVPHFA